MLGNDPSKLLPKLSLSLQAEPPGSVKGLGGSLLFSFIYYLNVVQHKTLNIQLEVKPNGTIHEVQIGS